MLIRRKGMLWLVVADGRSARILAQLDRASPLTLVGESAQIDGEGPRDRPYRTHDSHGRRHGLAEASTLRASRQARFLGGIADLINLSATANHFEHLVLAAPAKALGVLRAALNDDATRRVRAHFSIDLVKASETELAEWLASTEPHDQDDAVSNRKGSASVH